MSVCKWDNEPTSVCLSPKPILNEENAFQLQEKGSDGVDGGGGCVCWGAEGTSVLLTQSYCEPKTALGNKKVYYKGGGSRP